MASIRGPRYNGTVGIRRLKGGLERMLMEGVVGFCDKSSNSGWESES